MSEVAFCDVPVGERVERDPDHLLGAAAHVLERVEDPVVADVEVAHQLGQLRDGDAVVGHALEVQVHAQDREHEAKVGGDRRLAGEQRLHAGLDREVAAVDLVVEADHLVGQLVVAAGEGVQRRAERPQDEVALLLDRRLELLELLVERRSHPNRPVTYPSVRSSAGEVKIFSVESYSTSTPCLPSSSTWRLKNAVISATRAACCMLCVTITSV